MKKKELGSGFLSYKKDKSLIIIEETKAGGYFKAMDAYGRRGLVAHNNIEFYDEQPIYVQSVFHYEGLDEQELSFPADVVFRLLRKCETRLKIDGEEWWEGVYENKIGYFPAIFVQQLSQADMERLNSSSSTTTAAQPENRSSLQDELDAGEEIEVNSFIEYQKVP